MFHKHHRKSKKQAGITWGDCFLFQSCVLTHWKNINCTFTLSDHSNNSFVKFKSVKQLNVFFTQYTATYLWIRKLFLLLTFHRKLQSVSSNGFLCKQVSANRSWESHCVQEGKSHSEWIIIIHYPPQEAQRHLWEISFPSMYTPIVCTQPGRVWLSALQIACSVSAPHPLSWSRQIFCPTAWCITSDVCLIWVSAYCL